MIDSLHIRNFKCFENQMLKFGNLTVLTGLNGMGKSSILQALLLLRQSYQQSKIKEIDLALNGDLVQIGTAKDALFEGAQEELIGFELVWIDGKKAKWEFNYNKESDVLSPASHNKVHDEIYNNSLFSDAFHYLQAERIGPRTSFEMSDFLVRQHRQLGTRGEFAAHFLSVFGRNEIPNPNLAHSKGVSKKIQNQVEAWIGEVSPGARIGVLQHSGTDLISLQYSFEVDGQVVSNSYRPTNVGFGLTYTLPVLLAILSSENSYLILLENPEAHLHPKGQVLLGELIAKAANSGIQFIVETHSDHILNGIRLAVHQGALEPSKINLYFFDTPKLPQSARSNIVEPHIDRNGRIDYWPDGFFDEWDKSLEALLEPRNY